jgi:hypothetical protein
MLFTPLYSHMALEKVEQDLLVHTVEHLAVDLDVGALAALFLAPAPDKFDLAVAGVFFNVGLDEFEVFSVPATETGTPHADLDSGFQSNLREHQMVANYGRAPDCFSQEF